MDGFTHFDNDGNAIMVDVSEKAATSREAAAGGRIFVNEDVFTAIVQKTAKKGDVLGVARIAGIMAAKQASSLIPLCHTLLIQKCGIDFELNEEEHSIKAVCSIKVEGQTGAEMEALTGASVALLTIYDMCKAMDRSMVMTDIHLIRKSGGKSGIFDNPETYDDNRSRRGRKQDK